LPTASFRSFILDTGTPCLFCARKKSGNSTKQSNRLLLNNLCGKLSDLLFDNVWKDTLKMEF
jgi:hypothetical protein